MTTTTEVGCPKCSTILNAQAAQCDHTWHAANREAQLEAQLRASLTEPAPATIRAIVALMDEASDLSDPVNAAMREVFHAAAETWPQDGSTRQPGLARLLAAVDDLARVSVDWLLEEAADNG